MYLHNLYTCPSSTFAEQQHRRAREQLARLEELITRMERTSTSVASLGEWKKIARAHARSYPRKYIGHVYAHSIIAL
jgi:hypothetical protein